MKRESTITKLLLLLGLASLVFFAGCGGGASQELNNLPPSTATTGTSPTPSPSNNFTAVGNLTTARADHTATLLPNGEVLIAGGVGEGSQLLSSAELYDPSTGMFTPTGNMTTPRHWHTATLLANGKVLIAGGAQDPKGADHWTTSAELYDPSTGTFTATGSMIASGGAQSTLLLDGRVLMAEDVNAEVYDPATGTFSLTGAYAGPNPVWTGVGYTASLLQDGRVLVTGCAGQASWQCTVGASELFDPKTSTFTLTGASPNWFSISTAALLMWKETIMRFRILQKSTTPSPEHSVLSGKRAQSTSTPRSHAWPTERF